MSDTHRPSPRSSRKFERGMSWQIVGFVYFYLVLFALFANFSALKIVIFGAGDEAYIRAVDRLNIFVEVTVLPLVLTFVCICLHGVFFSRRIFGPIHRITEVLEQARDDNLISDEGAGEGDYLYRVSDELSCLCKRLQDDVARCHELSGRLADAGENLADAGEMTPEAIQRLVNLANVTQDLRKEMGGFSSPAESPSGAGASGNALEPDSRPAKQ